MICSVAQSIRCDRFRETDRWLKRWCELKHFAPSEGGTLEAGPALFYYKKKGDRDPSKV